MVLVKSEVSYIMHAKVSKSKKIADSGGTRTHSLRITTRVTARSPTRYPLRHGAAVAIVLTHRNENAVLSFALAFITNLIWNIVRPQIAPNFLIPHKLLGSNSSIVIIYLVNIFFFDPKR